VVRYLGRGSGGFAHFASRYPFMVTAARGGGGGAGGGAGGAGFGDDGSACGHDSRLLTQSGEHQLSYPNEVLRGALYFGNRWQAISRHVVLESLRITHIVNASLDTPNAFAVKAKAKAKAKAGEAAAGLAGHAAGYAAGAAAAAAAAAAGPADGGACGGGEAAAAAAAVAYFNIRVKDKPDQDIGPFLDPAADFIEAALAAGGRVLVHCTQGVSRSGVVVLYYIMRSRGWGLRRAWTFVAARRSLMFPNATFMRQLWRCEPRLLGGRGRHSLLEGEIESMMEGMLPPLPPLADGEGGDCSGDGEGGDCSGVGDDGRCLGSGASCRVS